MAALINGSVVTQLWLDRTCSVDLAMNATVCENIRDKEYKQELDIVQKKVSEYMAVGAYIDLIGIVTALYLGEQKQALKSLSLI